MKIVHIVSFILLVIGGLNWLLVGVVGWDVGELFGGMSSLVSRSIYILIGLGAVAALFTHKKDCKACSSGSASTPSSSSADMPPSSDGSSMPHEGV
jgi:uncharacterized protein